MKQLSRKVPAIRESILTDYIISCQPPDSQYRFFIFSTFLLCYATCFLTTFYISLILSKIRCAAASAQP